jgi:site-specific recombinase XerD
MMRLHHFHREDGDAGIKGARFHSLRHTFASNCVAEGVDLVTLQELFLKQVVAQRIILG